METMCSITFRTGAEEYTNQILDTESSFETLSISRFALCETTG